MSSPVAIAPPRTSIRRLRSWQFAFAFLVFCTSGCDLPGRPKTAEGSAQPQNEHSFDALYRRNCAGCHGPNGTLGPAPPLNDKLFRALIPDDELKRIVAEGRAGTLMPGFAAGKGGQLTTDQIALLVHGIKSHWGTIDPAPAGTPPYRLDSTAAGRDGAEPDGLKAFARACACCHGDEGRGEKFGGKDDDKLAGAINVPEFLALLSDQALRRLIITGRPDLRMPASSESQGRPDGFTPLTPQEVTELVSLLASWRAGTTSTGKGN